MEIRIEKNRVALLRLVRFWLALVRLFGGKPDRILPRRINLWAADQIFKAEKALYFLRVAAANSWQISAVEPVFSDAPMTIADVHARLIALKRGLVTLHDFAADKRTRIGKAHYARLAPNAPVWRISVRYNFSGKNIFQAQSRAPPGIFNNLRLPPLPVSQRGNASVRIVCSAAKNLRFGFASTCALRKKPNRHSPNPPLNALP